MGLPAKQYQNLYNWGYRNIDFYIMEAAYEKFKDKMFPNIED